MAASFVQVNRFLDLLERYIEVQEMKSGIRAFPKIDEEVERG